MTTGRVATLYGVPIERVKASVVGGTVTAAIGVALALLVGYGPGRAGAGAALGLGAGLLLAIPIVAAYWAARIRADVPSDELRVGWVEVAVWAVATTLLWGVVPWILFSPHWDALSAVYLAWIPLGSQVAGIVVFELAARAARMVRNRNLPSRQQDGGESDVEG